MSLTAADMEILEFERITFPAHQAGKKEATVRERWGYSAARHSQRLMEILDKPEAEAYDPALVHRLRRLRDARSAQRGARSWSA